MRNGYGYWLPIVGNSTLAKTGQNKSGIVCDETPTSQSGIMFGTATISGSPAEEGGYDCRF